MTLGLAISLEQQDWCDWYGKAVKAATSSASY